MPHMANFLETQGKLLASETYKLNHLNGQHHNRRWCQCKLMNTMLDHGKRNDRGKRDCIWYLRIASRPQQFYTEDGRKLDV